MIFVVGLAYLGIPFAVATLGDRLSARRGGRASRPVIYALSLAVYCTSWTYFGSVGIASRSGLDFLPIYIGPIIVFTVGWRLIQTIAEIAKRQYIASIADFLSARYGKSEVLGALATVIAAASHDILEPLNAARLFTSSLVNKLQRDGEVSLARNVDASLEAVEEILASLLDMSRLDAGAMKANPAPFRIDELLETLAREFKPSAAAKGLRLKTVHCGLTVDTDRKLLRRVLQNLLSNAIKYTASGRVLLGCRRRGRHLRIEVHDTGSGIPTSKRKLIFEEFRRLGEDHGRTTGLGPGLAIVERIARVLGSKVELHSGVGRGSAFAVRVPIASIQMPRAASLAQLRMRSGRHRHLPPC